MGGGTPVEAIRLGPARFAGWAVALCAEQRGRYFEAERLRGLEVDDQLVLGRRLDRKVGRLLALEDAVDVARRTPVKKLFDHLVGEQLHRVGHGETERGGGLQVDHQLELGRLQDRQIGWLGALEDAANIDASLVI
jgi:hypothetical protein